MEMAEPDVMSYIIDSSNHAQNPMEARNWLQADSRLIIVAGRLVLIVNGVRVHAC